MKKIILNASSFDGFITDKDKKNINIILKYYDIAIQCFDQIKKAMNRFSITALYRSQLGEIEKTVLGTL